MQTQLTQSQFGEIRDLMYRHSGVNLQPGKEELVKSRLNRRLRTLGLADFAAYLDLLREDRSGRELSFMIDELTTNKTSFFREQPHYDLLRERLLPDWRRRGGPLRIWSAGCSTGEEPYSLAIQLLAAVPDGGRRDAMILATDISPTTLAVMREAIYPGEALADVPAEWRQRYFEALTGEKDGLYRVREEVRALVRQARLNLMGTWPMRGPFDMIFCRNVMIYFDAETRERLVRRFLALLRPAGCLFVGHAESINASRHGLTYVQPAVYRI
ncbi:MAG: protein-glutamate O-methyltransferase CheR [Candidatus Krumholzibacteriota bacterium]|nr:protein-glutamate O-methyltransferase CheR [Candidatus Krumholzibacteriota bacterium]